MSRTHAEMRLFARATFSGFAGTATDAATYYLVLWIGAYAAGLYRPAEVLGAVLGAVANFLLGRYWAFRRTEKPIAMQALQYAGASVLTLLAVLGATMLLVEVLRVPQVFAYPPAKFFAYLVVSYPMARFVVFGGGGQTQ